jgi:hypothetical protein
MDERYRLATDDEFRILSQRTIPAIAGTYSGTVRIIGGGSLMLDDLEESKRLLPNTDIICVNVAGVVVPDATHLFSWHPKQLSAIKQFRRAEWADDKSVVHCQSEGSSVDYVWSFNGGTSVSGLTAIDLAYLLGYRRIALVGIPMDGNGYFYKRTDNVDMHDKERHSEVGKIRHVHGDMVKSFSGFTKEVFGHPGEWK